ncbi:MAG TPA: SgcJ/EcaC family oxidoreductase [Candidatus Limnocylindrales bacterium]|nr:SgcJ/EcaC family oxidoreductase [Candidatus Limnocylindrales bacterium]
MSYITNKSFLVSLACIAAVGLAPVHVTSSHAFGLGGGTTRDVKSQDAIRKLYSEFETEWNKHDVAKMAQHWAIDGDHVEPDGTMAKGRDEVTALLTKQHASVFKNSTLKLTVKSVWIMSDTVALVDGTYELSGAVRPDGEAVPTREGKLTSVLLLDKTWQIAASRLMIPTALPYKPKTAASPADAAAPKQP